MSIFRVKPLTAGQRFKTRNNSSLLSKKKPEKSLLKIKKSTGGRNNVGKMTMRYVGGGHKQKVRNIDFKRQKDDIVAIVKSIEYDPTRTAFIALIYYADGEKSYILAPEGLEVGDKVFSGEKAVPEIGCCLPLKFIPAGTFIHNIELNPNAGGRIAKSAGNSAQLISKDGDFVSIKMPSGKVRLVRGTCRATVGVLSNGDHKNEMVGKAGKNRWGGRRPRVRAVAMNPVDHPMGGGEGKASGGHPRSRKGKPAKGLKTRKNKKYSDKYINVK